MKVLLYIIMPLILMKVFEIAFIYFSLFITMNQNNQNLQKNTCPSNYDESEDYQSDNSLQFDRLTINDRKISQNQTELQFCIKKIDGQELLKKADNSKMKQKSIVSNRKNKVIQKKGKIMQEQRKANFSRKRKIICLQNKIEELQRQIASLRRNEHYCFSCRTRCPNYYEDKIQEIIQPQEIAAHGKLDYDGHRRSKDSLEFQKIDFHTPLMQTEEMEEKMWIFVGTMLIAMGSKIMDFDGTINVFKILKESVDNIRRQVDKCQTKLGLQFYCCKEELSEPNSLIDGVNFDPFYNSKQENLPDGFSLQGVKLQTVDAYQLIYDYKYNFNIKYDALLTIMEYARQNCSLS